MKDPQQFRVLVIDGAEEVADLVRDVLEEEGYAVSVATETPATLSDVAQDGVDLVIVDPGSGGQDPETWVQRGMERDIEAIDIPLVLCTSHPRLLHDLHDDLAKRNIDVLPKPFDLETLLHVVEERCDPASAVPASGGESGATP